MWEWNLDWYAAYTNPCDSCADLTSASYRVMRGADFAAYATYLWADYRGGDYPGDHSGGIGARCARTNPLSWRSPCP